MKVKANWPVNTGKKLQETGSVFDVSDEQGAVLVAAGAVEDVGRKKNEDAGGKGPEGDGGAGGAGGDPTPPAA